MLEKTIGQRIKKARLSKKYTQLQFSHKTNLTQAIISGYENDRIIPSEKVLKNISQALEVKVSWLRYGEGSTIDEITEIKRILNVILDYIKIPRELLEPNMQKKAEKSVYFVNKKKNEKKK